MGNRQALVLVVGMLLQQGSMFLLGLAVAQSLGASPYGTFSLVRTLIVFAITVAPLGLDLAISKYAAGANARDEFDPVFSSIRMVVLTNSVLVGIVVVVLGWIVFRDDPEGIPWAGLVVGAATLLPMADGALQAARARASGQIVLVSIVSDYSVSLLRIAATFGLWFLGGSLALFLGANLVAISIGVAALNLFARYQQAGPFWRPQHLMSAIGYIRESIWMAISLAAHGLIRFADLYVLGLWNDRGTVGSYAAISLVANFIQIYPSAIAVPVAPAVARAHRDGNPDEAARLIKGNMLRGVVVAAYVFGGIAGFGRYLNLVFGNEFSFSWQVCLLLALAWLISSVLASAGLGLSMTGGHRTESRILIGSLTILIILLLTLVPPFGAAGAATSILVSVTFINLLRVRAVTCRLGSIVDPRLLILPTFSLLLATILSTTLNDTITGNLRALIAACILYTAIYGATYFFARRLVI